MLMDCLWITGVSVLAVNYRCSSEILAEDAQWKDQYILACALVTPAALNQLWNRHIHHRVFSDVSPMSALLTFSLFAI